MNPTCPLCAEDETERESVQEYDGVALCTYHALAAQINEEGIRERIAAHKAPARPIHLLAMVQVRGSVDWLMPGATPPRGAVVLLGPSTADRVLYADGIALGQVTDVAVDRDHFYAEGATAPTQTVINRTDIEFILDVSTLGQHVGPL